MTDKQGRYRQRKIDQGLKRVEVLVPSESVPYLKAYARALRDAHQLGLITPSFEGMPRRESPEFRYVYPPSDSHPTKTIEKNIQKPQDKTQNPDFSTGLFRDTPFHENDS